MTTQYIVGLDPAQLKDWSALAVVKRTWMDEQKANRYELVALDRKQHLPYPDIIDWTIKVFKNSFFQPDRDHSPPMWDLDEPELVMDTTGVGRALWDLFRGREVYPIGATITAGSSLAADCGVYHLGKALLIGRFLAAFDSGRVLVNPALPMWSQLERELVNYRAKISASGNAQFEAASGEHDDLLFAVALAVWWGEESRKY